MNLLTVSLLNAAFTEPQKKVALELITLSMSQDPYAELSARLEIRENIPYCDAERQAEWSAYLTSIDGGLGSA